MHTEYSGYYQVDDLETKKVIINEYLIVSFPTFKIYTKKCMSYSISDSDSDTDSD